MILGMQTPDLIRWLAILSLLTTRVQAQSIDLRSELITLVNSELAFSKASVDKGMREAFLEFLAERSIVFRPQPTDGRLFYSDVRDTAVLSWYPVAADISRTADLGYTTGPYEYRPIKSGEARNVDHGYYVSVWRKQKDGSWKVVLDIGNPNPPPKSKPAAWKPPPSYATEFNQPVADIKIERARLMELDRRPHKTETWQPVYAEIARGADLGFTYGKRTNSERLGQQYYVRIWRRDRSGQWKMVLEVMKPQPVQITK